MRMCNFGAQNSPFFLKKMFLVQTIIIIFIYLLALFIVQNLKKFLQQIQSYEYAPFLGPKWFICPKELFFWKIINIILIYIFCAKFLKKSSSRSRVMRMHNFWAHNGSIPQMRTFSENLLMILVSFIHDYLHTKI